MSHACVRRPPESERPSSPSAFANSTTALRMPPALTHCKSTSSFTGFLSAYVKRYTPTRGVAVASTRMPSFVSATV